MKYWLAPGRTSARADTRRGYSLIELMIVVAIVGILAAVAIPSFVSYLHKSKASEATSFLAAIKQRQAAYFAEMGQYCDVDDPNPATMPSDGDTAPWTASTGWSQLGASPESPEVYFQYNSFAGAPGSVPSSKSAFNDNRGYDGTDFWFISTARGNLDGDSEVMTFESYSANSRLWMSDEKGWE